MNIRDRLTREMTAQGLDPDAPFTSSIIEAAAESLDPLREETERRERPLRNRVEELTAIFTPLFEELFNTLLDTTRTQEENMTDTARRDQALDHAGLNVANLKILISRQLDPRNWMVWTGDGNVILARGNASVPGEELTLEKVRGWIEDGRSITLTVGKYLRRRVHIILDGYKAENEREEIPVVKGIGIVGIHGNAATAAGVTFQCAEGFAPGWWRAGGQAAVTPPTGWNYCHGLGVPALHRPFTAENVLFVIETLGIRHFFLAPDLYETIAPEVLDELHRMADAPEEKVAPPLPLVPIDLDLARRLLAEADEGFRNPSTAPGGYHEFLAELRKLLDARAGEEAKADEAIKRFTKDVPAGTLWSGEINGVMVRTSSSLPVGGWVVGSRQPAGHRDFSVAALTEVLLDPDCIEGTKGINVPEQAAPILTFLAENPPDTWAAWTTSLQGLLDQIPE